MVPVLKWGATFQGLTTVDTAHPPIINSSSNKDVTKTGDGNEGRGRVFGLRLLSQAAEYETEEVTGNYRTPDLTLYNDHAYDSDKTDELPN
ncbi:hypothetical protein F4810DRAFT_707243 [Camillea tinctor]|nr:hypothetical protein F4810DRAFT_707243 [Camillea tinctor]